MRNGDGVMELRNIFLMVLLVIGVNGCGGSGGCVASVAFGSIAKDACTSNAPAQNQSDNSIDSSFVTTATVILNN